MANERLIDLNLLRPFVGDNKEMQQQLLAAFEKELSAFHESMTDAASNNKLEVVRAINHRISPSLKMLHQQKLIDLMEGYKQLLAAYESNAAVLKAHLVLINVVTIELLSE